VKADIDVIVVDFESRYVVVIFVFVNLVCGLLNQSKYQHSPASTPITEVNKSASAELTFGGAFSSVDPSLAVGMTKLPQEGALKVVNVTALILLSIGVVTIRASRITRSFRSSCSVSG